eukprot:TRINITY_DN587_c0_g1_i3.p1 TRINITY_DN587_c0_g1~~TRINITY_DN587_c0_g1_i3.p1  ORF type:complete len:1377 (+),score=731.02 TRINITY_DN587_c0_g1_i3:157-4287(+)
MAEVPPKPARPESLALPPKPEKPDMMFSMPPKPARPDSLALPPKPERPESLILPSKPSMPAGMRNSVIGETPAMTPFRKGSVFGSAPTQPDRPRSSMFDEFADVEGEVPSSSYIRPTSSMGMGPSAVPSAVPGAFSTIKAPSAVPGSRPTSTYNPSVGHMSSGPTYYPDPTAGGFVPPFARPAVSNMFDDFNDDFGDTYGRNIQVTGGDFAEDGSDDDDGEDAEDGRTPGSSSSFEGGALPERPAAPNFYRGSVRLNPDDSDYQPAMPERPNLPTRLDFGDEDFLASDSFSANIANDMDFGGDVPERANIVGALPPGSYIGQATGFDSSAQTMPGVQLEETKSRKAWNWLKLKAEEAQDLTNQALTATGIVSKEQAKANQYVKATLERVKANDPELDDLQLSSCRLNKKRVKKLREALKTNTNVKKIDFNKMGLDDAEDSIRVLTKSLAYNNNITWLDLRSNQIGLRTCKAVQDLLKVNLNVTRVDIQEQIYKAPNRYILLRALQSIQWLMQMNFQYQLFRANKHGNLNLCGRGYKQIVPRLLENGDHVVFFDISYNELEFFPEDIKIMTNVQFFLAGYNLLESIPGPSFAAFEKLVKLDLSHNKITKLPDEITEIVSLQELYLHNNALTELPESFRMLTSLKKVNLANNMLTGLPEELSNLFHLEYLNVNTNQLTKIPDSLIFLVGLRFLDLSKNMLTSLPEEQPNMPNLEVFLLNENQIIQLPEYIGECRNIRKMDLSFNKLTSLPEEICQLRHMEEFLIHNNLITQLPESIGNLWRLTYLDAHINKITSLPVQLQLLKYLNYLDLSYNKLKRLDDFLCTLRGLNTLKLIKNEPLKGMPKSILEKGDDIALSFIRHLPLQAIQQARMKLMVIGKEGVGKTSIVECLNRKMSKKKAKVKDQFVPTPTDGINVLEMSTMKGTTEIQYSVWDFSGKEGYINTHQLFFSERAVYLLVCNMLDPEEDDEIIESWLEMISIRVGRVPVIIVGTHLDEKACGTKHIKNFWKRIKGKVQDRGNVVGYEAVSGSQNKKIDNLLTRIVKITSQQDPFPTQLTKGYEYLESRTKLLRKLMKTPMTSFKRFREEIIACGIHEHQVDTCMKHFSDAGIIVYFPLCPSLVFLGPEWIVNLISTFNDIKQYVKRGMVDRSDFLQIWDPEQYPEKYHEYILMLLERFELLMRLKDQGKIFFPELLEEEATPSQSTLNFMWNPGYEMEQPEFRRIFKFHFVPQFMFARIIGRMMYGMGWELQNYWKNGAILNKEYADESIFLKLDPTERCFYITVRGENAADQIVNTIKMIESTSEQMHLSHQTFVPCTHCLLLEENKKPFSFPITDFETAESEGKGYVMCQGEVAVKLRALLPYGSLKMEREGAEEMPDN